MTAPPYPGAEPHAMTPTLVICRLDDPAVRPAACRELLTRPERERIDGLRQERARDRALVARALLRLELAERLACRPEAIEFSYGPQGKPALAGDDAWHFNLSHSHDRVVLAITRGAPVGVDVEWRHRPARIDALSRHWYGEEECAELASLDDEARRYRFFQMWTLKEAVTKGLGVSLWSTLADIRVTGLRDGTPALHLGGAAHCGAPMAWWHFDAGDGYNLALTHLAGAGVPPRIHRVRPGEAREPLPLVPDLSGVHHPVETA